MKRAIVLLAAISMVCGASAFAVSDGQYRPSNQGCTGWDDNSKSPSHVGTNNTDVTKSCHSALISVSDQTGHQYLGYGLDQTPERTPAHSGELWMDLGNGTRQVLSFDLAGPGTITNPRLSTQQGTPADPSTGLVAYFGMDDNADFGEHDSSSQVNNGPSDGGAVKVDINPAAAATLLLEIKALQTSLDASGLLGNPAPFASAGTGACADGICAAFQTQKRLAFDGGNINARDVANYAGVQWDPYSCSGPSDSLKDCGNKTMAFWAHQAARAYVEPGLQIYEDPDPQGSPGVLSFAGLDAVKQTLTGDGNDPYPIPALYIGTCGFVFGGGSDSAQPTWFPDGPAVNNAGQIVLGNPQLCG